MRVAQQIEAQLPPAIKPECHSSAAVESLYGSKLAFAIFRL